LLFWLLREIEQDPRLELQLVVTGSHLAPEFGATIDVIRRDGFRIADTVEMLLATDTFAGMAKAVGLAVIGFADVLTRLRPDVVVVLGDRFEIFAAAQAAALVRLPLAHIHGGETSEGAIDEQLRHAITKLAHLHFVTAEPHRKRVIQMGEDPESVYLVGAPGLDNIALLGLLDRAATEQVVGMPFSEPTFLVTYHSTTLGEAPEAGMTQLLAALDAFPESSIVITMPNADAGGRVLAAMAQAYAADHPDRVRYVKSLGQVNYLSMLAHADVIIGNSSSGLVEAPALHRPTVNIGARQKGRLRPATVIDCDEECRSIKAAIDRALSAEMRALAATSASPYGEPGKVSKAIKRILAEVTLAAVPTKHFFDRDVVA
jgi:UDP-N-acetylglucosamine 2-epimerase (non-hydrolysing)/GDP/UDP-N,N'-diacetylbacillosamine 2-epimerase (hydrolysing)